MRSVDTSPWSTGRRTFLAGAASLFAPAVHARTEPASFGLTPVFLDSDLRLTRDIETYLTASLGRSVTLVKRRTYMEITSLLVAGHLDAAWIWGSRSSSTGLSWRSWRCRCTAALRGTSLS
jgi:phosphonate transport system substrate-binding protein